MPTTPTNVMSACAEGGREGTGQGSTDTTARKKAISKLPSFTAHVFIPTQTNTYIYPQLAHLVFDKVACIFQVHVLAFGGVIDNC